MGHLTDNMARLRREIDDNREARLAQQHTRAIGVGTMLAEFASVRAHAAQRDARARKAFVVANEVFVARNTNNVLRLLQELHGARQLMARQGREGRAAFVADVAQATVDLLARFDADRNEMAKRSAKQRADFVADFVADMARDIAGLLHARMHMAHAGARERARFVNQVATQVSAMLGDFHKTRARMARLSAEARSRYVKTVADEVSEQLESFYQARATIAMTKSTSSQRAAFVSSLAGVVREVAQDRAAARRVFLGSPAPAITNPSVQTTGHQAVEHIVAQPVQEAGVHEPAELAESVHAPQEAESSQEQEGFSAAAKTPKQTKSRATKDPRKK